MRALYGYWRSSAAFRLRIAFGLKGLDYEYRAVNIKPGESEQNLPEYLEMNPEGRVPFLIDGDVRLSQSPAMLEYLEEAYPEVSLLPEGVADRAEVRSLMNLITCDVHPLNNLAVLSYLQDPLGADSEAIKAWYAHWVVRGLEAYDIRIRAHTGRYSFGDNVTLADVCLVPQIWNARRFDVSLDGMDQLLRVEERLMDLEAFQRAMPEVQPDAPTHD